MDAVTPGTLDTALGTVVLKAPDPLLFELDTIRSAAMALSMLLVVERDTDAPNTAITDTSASPTMSAEAV